MQLGWIDFSKEDRQKAFDVINLLSEQGAVDELGIGVIRDAFANYFFPGTSTIQTRAKYFLIVPYMLREAVDGRYGKDANRVLRAIDSAEKDCGIRLLEADPKAEGVIGSRVLPKGWVARKPSDIYWNGIRTFVVMSPFLSESVIADFNLTDRALSDCKRTLVTRRSELGKLKASDVDNFTIYALKDEIIDGEEEISDELADKKKQDIHAKIYLRRKYSDVDL